MRLMMLILSAALVGCQHTTPQALRLDRLAIAKREGWNDEITSYVANSRIAVGMTQMQVLAAINGLHPRFIQSTIAKHRTVFSSGVYDTWYWTPYGARAWTFNFTNGLLESYTQHEHPSY